jgi:hypothetical protein
MNDDPNDPNGPRPTDVPCEGGGLAAGTSRDAVRLLNFQGTVGDRGAISRALAALQDAAADARADGDHGAAELDVLGRLQHMLAGIGDAAVHDPRPWPRAEVLEDAEGRVATVLDVPVNRCLVCGELLATPEVAAVLAWAQTKWLPMMPAGSHRLIRWGGLVAEVESAGGL